MKKHWPWILTGLIALWVLSSLRSQSDKEGDFQYREFGKLPVLLGGRLQPLESVARNNLLIIRGTTRVPLEGNAGDGSWGAWEEIADKGGLTERKWYQFSKRPAKIKPVQWLLEIFGRPETADSRYIFRMHHPELLGEMGLADAGVDRSGLRFYSFNQIQPHLSSVENSARQISSTKAERRSPYQKAVMDLHRALQLYIRLKNSVRPQMMVDDDKPFFSLPKAGIATEVGFEDRADGLYSYNQVRTNITAIRTASLKGGMEDEAAVSAFSSFMGKYQVYESLRNVWRDEWRGSFETELRDYETALESSLKALQQERMGQSPDPQVMDRAMGFLRRYSMLDNMAYPHIIPPGDGSKDAADWEDIGAALMAAMRNGKIPPAAFSYASMVSAYGNEDHVTFNKALTEYRASLSQTMPEAVKKGAEESTFNSFMPFERAIKIYLLGLVITLIYWLRMSEGLRTSGFQLILLALIVHTVGLIFRMYLERRPPVTNLYSSAIFVGWGAAVLGVILERIHRNGIGIVTASGVGYITLIIAHHLSMDGDTMEMMRAVLDTNFWLATHVTIITIGYAATFLAGFIAIVYVLRGLLTPSLDDVIAKSLTRMVYGIVCFATLFSFVGTVLGGLWADWSWGRFWGWDPKENGALLIVIWNAAILHMRWGGMIRDRGLMNCAIFGNIVTAFSWFGVNMLGIGLHSYGFMDAAFKWLAIFSCTQLVLIALASIPFTYWMSVKKGVLKPAGFKPAA